MPYRDSFNRRDAEGAERIMKVASRNPFVWKGQGIEPGGSRLSGTDDDTFSILSASLRLCGEKIQTNNFTNDDALQRSAS